MRQSPQTVQNVVTYDVVVGVRNADLALKPGLTATTRLIIDERSERRPRAKSGAALHAGRRDAVQAQEPAGSAGQSRVWVLRDGEPVPVSVDTGLDDDSFTEIIQRRSQAGRPSHHRRTSGAVRGPSAVPRPRL